MSTAQLSPGTIVDGRFTIGAAAWAREGAQSYAATDAQQGQPVVLTAYAPACFSSGLVLERSLRELRQLQTLQSPRVATVIACGKLPDGGIYEVVGMLPDARLDALVAGGALPGPQAALLIEQIGEGLLEAQKAGVIHRNLGPRVVFVGPEGAVVTGFSVGEPHSDKSFGPLDTIAPEQVEGKVVDQRTLIYNLAALMHMLITGAPLFAGDAATQLPAHLSGEIPADVNARLRRALGKDPRMRPMMLKQFLAELRAIGGGVARAPMAPSTGGESAPPLPGGPLTAPGAGAKPAGSPTSRGWTMFMQGEAPAAGTAAPTAAAGATAVAPAPAPTGAPGKPKTRGWTMFMEGTDEPAHKPEDKPAAKPSTRGWTMFMEDEEGQAPPSEAESPIAQAVAPAPVSEAAGAQPKTRGWTMFMEDEEGQAAPAPAPESESATVVAPAPTPAGAPPIAGGSAVKPSTRGWTMFMKDDEQAEAVALAQPAAQAPDEPETKIFAASPAAAAPPVAPPPAAAPVASASTPKSRGWTMFTEASDDEATQAVAMATPLEAPPAPAEVEAPSAELAASPAEPSAASSSTAMGRRGDADAPKKRGWTMFMESPLDKGKDPLGGVAPSSGESNAKGWTVFSPAADTGAQPAADSAQLAMEAPGVEPPMAAPAAFEQELASTRDPASQAAAGQTSFEVDEAAAYAQQAAEDDRMRARTVVVTGPPDASLANNRLQTMIVPHSPAAPPPMDAGMSGAASGPISTGLSGPISTGMSGPASSSMPVHAGSHAMEPAKKGSPVVLIVVGVVLVAAAIGAAYVFLT